MDANTMTLNPILRFKDGTIRNTARLSKAEWDKHKDLLCSLYQEKSIREVLVFMETKYGFVAK